MILEAPNFVTKGLKWSDDFVPNVDIEERTVSGYISTPYQDRDGEIVLTEAFEKHLDSYKNNPILLLSHQHKTLPVGKAIELEIRPQGLWAKYQFASTPAGEETFTLFKEGCLRGFSVGFMPINKIAYPPVEMIPKEYLKTSLGRPTKALYKEVELVEVSALAVVSNRGALVDRAEKGNSIAGLVVKMFDAEDDISLVVKEWVDAYCFDQIITKGGGLVAMRRYLENHPFPIFSSEPSRPEEESSAQMEQILNNQAEMIQQLEAISGKDSWREWAKKWGIGLGAATAAYLLFRKTNLGKSAIDYAKERIKDWSLRRPKNEPIDVEYTVVREYGDNQEEQQLNDSLDILTLALNKGREVGAEDTDEFDQFKIPILEIENAIRDLPEEEDSFDKTMKKAFAVSFDLLITKEMTKEEFKESEHPRASDGKFRDKSDVNSALKITREPSQKPTKKIASKQKPAEKTSRVLPILKKVAEVTVGTAGVVVAGFMIAKKASLYGRKKANLKQIKKTIEEIRAASSAPNEKAIEAIANLRVENRVYDWDKLSDSQRALATYINSDSFQIDLSKHFGHLPAQGTKRIVVLSETGLSELSPLSPTKSFARRSIGYYVVSDTIYVNLKIFKQIEEHLAQYKIADPKTLLLHEYAHSITLAHPEIANRHMDEYKEALDKIVWGEMHFSYAAPALQQLNIKAGAYRIERVELFRRESPVYGSKNSRLKNAEYVFPVFLLRNLGDNSYAYFAGMFLNSPFAVPGPIVTVTDKMGHAVDDRTLYGLGHLSEFCSVLVERGGQL